MTYQQTLGLAAILGYLFGTLIVVGVIWGAEAWRRWRWRREIQYRARLARRVFTKGDRHEQ